MLFVPQYFEIGSRQQRSQCLVFKVLILRSPRARFRLHFLRTCVSTSYRGYFLHDSSSEQRDRPTTMPTWHDDMTEH